MRAPVMVPEALAHDWRQLQDLIAATMRRQPVPCQSHDDATRALWTGTAAQQTIAARQCPKCPVIAQCRDYGLQHPSEEGVYGGLTPHNRKDTTMTTSTQGRNAHAALEVSRG